MGRQKKIKQEALGCPVAQKSAVKVICRLVVSIIVFQFNGCCVVRSLAYNGCVYETFGISKRFPIKLQLLLIRAVPLDKPLYAKCFIHVVGVSLFIFLVNFLSFLLHRFCLPCVGVGKLFCRFWF